VRPNRLSKGGMDSPSVPLPPWRYPADRLRSTCYATRRKTTRRRRPNHARPLNLAFSGRLRVFNPQDCKFLTLTPEWMCHFPLGDTPPTGHHQLTPNVAIVPRPLLPRQGMRLPDHPAPEGGERDRTGKATECRIPLQGSCRGGEAPFAWGFGGCAPDRHRGRRRVRGGPRPFGGGP
jgi:hypothetical protein